MRKAEKVMIAKAEEVIKIWNNGVSEGSIKPAMDTAIDELEVLIKKVKGGV